MVLHLRFPFELPLNASRNPVSCTKAWLLDFHYLGLAELVVLHADTFNHNNNFFLPVSSVGSFMKVKESLHLGNP